MRDIATLRFIRDRVLSEIAAHPPTGPLLGETPTRAPRTTCRNGHAALYRQPSGELRCAECRRQQDRRRRIGVDR